jgi:hypothetical protein
MEAVRFSEMPVDFYRPSRRHITNDRALRTVTCFKFSSFWNTNRSRNNCFGAHITVRGTLPLCWLFLQKLTVAQAIKKGPPFIDLKVHLRCWQKQAIGNHQSTQWYFFNNFPSAPRFSTRFHSCRIFSQNVLWSFMFPMPATCPAHSPPPLCSFLPVMPPAPFAKVHVCVPGSTRRVEAAVT